MGDRFPRRPTNKPKRCLSKPPFFERMDDDGGHGQRSESGTLTPDNEGRVLKLKKADVDATPNADSRTETES